MGLLAARRLEGPLDRGGRGRGREGVAARADAARDLRGEGQGAVGARLRHEPRPLRARDQRQARGRPALHAGLDELPPPPAVPDLRRHAPTCAPGENAIGATLGDGWYRGYLAWKDRRNVYGDRLALLCQLRIEYEDGRVETVGTDGTWKSATGPIRTSDIYNGETYDARLERPGWSAPGYDDKDWAPVRVVEAREAGRSSPRPGPPVRRIEEVRPVKILKTPAGETVFDMGQNMVGHVRLKVRGPAGTTVTLRHAEVLDKAGNFYTANLRAAKQHGDVHPQGRRRGGLRAALHLPGLPLRRGRGLAGRADARRPHRRRRPLGHAGRPGSSTTLEPAAQPAPAQHPLGPEGQLPRRADRLPAARRAAGLDGRRAGLLPHRRASTWTWPASSPSGWATWPPTRAAKGGVPHVVPDVAEPATDASSPGGSAAWADAATIIPWNMYLALRRHAPPRAAVPEHEGVGRVHAARGRATSYLWTTGFHFGDWLAFATTALRLPGRHDRQGPDRHRLLRPLDRPPAAGGGRPRARRRTRPSTPRSCRRSRRRSCASS